MDNHLDLVADLKAQITRLRTSEGYLNAGLPNYDHLFGRDSCISALQLLEFDPTIAAATLRVLARFQGNRRHLLREEFSGKILHEHFPGGWRQMLGDLIHDSDRLRLATIFILWRFPYYGTVDAGAWFMLLLHAYYEKTGDSALVHELWPTVLGIDHWLRHHARHTKLGLVGFKRHYIFGLRNQSWKDNINLKITPPTAMIEVQGYYFLAYHQMSHLARNVMNDPTASERFEVSANALQDGFAKNFSQDADGSLPLAVNGRGVPVRFKTSNPGHLLFSGILDKAGEKQVVRALFQPDLWTPYGIRTESTLSPNFDPASYHHGSVWPFDNWVIYQGLLKRGYTKEAGQIRDALIKAFRELTNIPELYSVSITGTLSALPSACTIQAWSTGALYELLTTPTQQVL